MPAQNVIRVVQQPNGARYNAPLAVQPIIEFGTLDNNVFTRDTTKNTGSVLVSEGFQGTNAGYDLTGTLTANFVNGLATFTNVGIVPDATNTTLDISPATLVFTSVGVNTISSAQFNISNASKLIRTSPSSTTTITALTNRPIRWPITVQLADNDGVAVPLSGVNVTVTANGATLSGVTTGSTNSNGNVTFSNLVLSAGTQATLTFSAVGITSYTVTIDISPVDIIKPKRSEVTGKNPTTDDLVEYEIAVNIPDKKIFVRDSKDNVQIVASVDVPPVTSVAGKTGAVTLEINDLTDVDTTTAPTNNQTLVWNNSQSNWLPGNVVNSISSSTLAITNSSGPTATVELSTIAGISGTYNSSSKISPLTIDSYGRVSAVGSAVSITPAWSNITGTPTTLAGYGITDAQPLDMDLTKIASLTQTNGLLKKTATDTWTLDTNTYLTGNQSITLSGDATGSGATSISVTLANSGVTAGNYTKVAVDSKGRVTSGSNPTTLSGYGITDASLNTHTHTFAELTNKPTTLAEYGITDAATSTHTHTFAVITSKPTTVSGYGITDAVTTAQIGVVNGVAGLDGTGKVPSSQLPSFVDDVLEYSTLSGFPATGSTGIIYVDQSTSKIYRWSGSAYIEISPTAGNSDTATKLSTARTISLTSDVTGSVSFDGSANVSITTTLSNSGVTAGTYKSVTVNAKGRVTAGTNPTTLVDFGITDAYTKTEVDSLVASGGADWANITSIPTTLTGYGILTETTSLIQSEISSALPSASVSYANTAGDASTADYIAVTDNTAGVGSLYPLLTNANSGDVLVNTSSAVLTFVPSTGTLSATKFSGSGASLTSLSASNISSGTLAIANGGTNNQAIPTAGGVAYGTGTKYAVTGAGTSGQVLISQGSSPPIWSTLSAIPTGTVQMFAGTTIPTGWLECDGSTVSSTNYLSLHSVISNTYGGSAYTGAAGLSFQLPDMRSRFPLAYGSGTNLTPRTTMGQKLGAETHTLTSGQMPQHSHSFTPAGTLDTKGSHSHSSTNNVLVYMPALNGGANLNPGNSFQHYNMSVVMNNAGDHSHSFTGTGGTTGTTPSSPNTSVDHMNPFFVIKFIIKT